MYTIKEIIKTLDSFVNEGFDSVNDGDLDEALRISVDVFNIIQKYNKNHPMALECNGEYIYQNDQAQEDAIEFTSEICDALSKYSEYEEE